jgi:hypothetical protein
MSDSMHSLGRPKASKEIANLLKDIASANRKEIKRA